MWFHRLMGFSEQGPSQVRERCAVQGEELISRVNGARYHCGRLETPSLAELRERASELPDLGPPTLREQVANVQDLHLAPELAGATFQAASQFNLLEMAGPSITPEAGVGIYEHDGTQGPACAVACGAGTIYRNYFVSLPGQTGQSAELQVDCLADLGQALGNEQGALWRMQNGYALLSASGRAVLSERLASVSSLERERLGGLLRVGVQWETQVTLKGAQHRVTQVYGSALPVAYGGGEPHEWEAMARLVLNASYQATLLVAQLNAHQSGCRTVFLTLLGGGVFGNERAWILESIKEALRRNPRCGLDVVIVSYGRSQPSVRALVQEWSERGGRE